MLFFNFSIVLIFGICELIIVVVIILMVVWEFLVIIGFMVVNVLSVIFIIICVLVFNDFVFFKIGFKKYKWCCL